MKELFDKDFYEYKAKIKKDADDSLKSLEERVAKIKWKEFSPQYYISNAGFVKRVFMNKEGKTDT